MHSKLNILHGMNSNFDIAEIAHNLMNPTQSLQKGRKHRHAMTKLSLLRMRQQAPQPVKVM